MGLPDRQIMITKYVIKKMTKETRQQPNRLQKPELINVAINGRYGNHVFDVSVAMVTVYGGGA